MSVRSGTLPPDGVRRMFDGVAPVYDLMNRLMTAGLDGGWRRAAVAAAVGPGDRVLDVACGTGDLALAAEHAGAAVTAVDFSPRMLERARRKSSGVAWVEADALELPFPDGSFDAVTVGFGVRHFPDIPRGLAELRRVLREGGRIAVLDLTTATGPLAPFYRVWFDTLIPSVGRFLPGGAAFTYLPASVRRFARPEELARALAGASFDDVRWRLLAGRIVALHTGTAR